MGRGWVSEVGGELDVVVAVVVWGKREGAGRRARRCGEVVWRHDWVW